MLGWRCRDLDLAYLPFAVGKGIAQYTSDPVFQRKLIVPAEAAPLAHAAVQQIGLHQPLRLLDDGENVPLRLAHESLTPSRALPVR